eukprot:2037552-Lingulodinium_polyedra.AAC.1
MRGRLPRRAEAARGGRPRRRVEPDLGHLAGLCHGGVRASGAPGPLGRCRGGGRGPRAAPR